MAKTIRKSERQRLAKRAHRGRSEVYRYLRKNLAALQADGFGTSTGPSWDELAETAHRDGYTNRNGERITGDAIRKVFARAVRDAALIPPTIAPQAPSRQRADWQPPSTGTPVSSPLPVSTIREFEPNEEAAPRRRALEPPAHAPPSVSKKMTIEDLTPEARAQIESLRQDFAATDRKRFGRF